MKFIHISEIPEFYPETIELHPVASTWASTGEDIQKGTQFLSWSDPENIIHKFQWELVKLVTDQFLKMDPRHPRYQEVRKRFDIGLASDHFFWASGKPWWSLEVIEDGAYHLLETIRMIPNVDAKALERASSLYELVISTAFNWQRTGRIRTMAKEQKAILRIPFKDRTIGKGGDERGVYHAFVKMMKDLEKKAAKVGDYEQAILWRDAIYKLENKLDIYDTVNAIDLLRVKLPHGEVERTIEEYKAKYRQIRGGQPEQRGN